MTVSRQQARAVRREMTRAGEAVLASGLAATPRRSQLAGLAMVMSTRLERGSAAAAAEAMHRAFESSLSAHPVRLKLDCAKGCAWCCHAWVGATAPEVFLAAAAVAAKTDAWRRAFAGRADAAYGLGIEARLGAKLPCAMLVEGACSIYASRPAVCRKTTSTRVGDCIDEFEGRALDRDITMSKAHVDFALACRVALAAALRHGGRSEVAYELAPAVARALASPDAEPRWLAGEDVFAGLPTAPAEAPAFDGWVSTIARDLGQPPAPPSP